MRGSVVIVGAGEHGRKAYHVAKSAGWDVVAFVDARVAKAPVDGVPVWAVGALSHAIAGCAVHVAIGSGVSRRKLVEESRHFGWTIATLVHSAACVAPDVQLAPGVLVAAGAVIESGTVAGEGAIIDIGAVIDHDSVVGPYSHVRPGAIVPAHGRVMAEAG